jgi:hypothetical protein
MSNDVTITYINESTISPCPEIFVFGFKPQELQKDNAWRVIEDIGTHSQSMFTYPANSAARGAWTESGGEQDATQMLAATPGQKFEVVKDGTGIVIKSSGSSGVPEAIQIENKVQVDGGIIAQICKDGLVYLEKRTLTNQIAQFQWKPVLYFEAAVTKTTPSGTVTELTKSFELNLEGQSTAVIKLNGTSMDDAAFSTGDKS